MTDQQNQPTRTPLPVVELWEGELVRGMAGSDPMPIRQFVRETATEAYQVGADRVSWNWVKKHYTLRRTHVCKWEPADE